jgi:hypothetical protein
MGDQTAHRRALFIDQYVPRNPKVCQIPHATALADEGGILYRALGAGQAGDLDLNLEENGTHC